MKDPDGVSSAWPFLCSGSQPHPVCACTRMCMCVSMCKCPAFQGCVRCVITLWETRRHCVCLGESAICPIPGSKLCSFRRMADFLLKIISWEQMLFIWSHLKIHGNIPESSWNLEKIHDNAYGFPSYCVSAFLIVRWFVLTSFRFTWGLWTLHTRKGWNSNCYPLGEDWLCFLALSPGSTCGGFRVQTQSLASLLTVETVHQGWGWGKLVVSLCEMILDDVHPHLRKEGFSGHTGPAPCCAARCNMESACASV